MSSSVRAARPFASTCRVRLLYPPGKRRHARSNSTAAACAAKAVAALAVDRAAGVPGSLEHSAELPVAADGFRRKLVAAVGQQVGGTIDEAAEFHEVLRLNVLVRLTTGVSRQHQDEIGSRFRELHFEAPLLVGT